MVTKSATEKTPLISSRSVSTVSVSQESVHRESVHKDEKEEGVTLKKDITLWSATGICIGAVCGSGIFISPAGVTQNVGSVGLTLIIWAVAGLIQMMLALCYVELGTAIPVSGGDYAYIHHTLGALPAFQCLWATLLMVSVACAMMARTSALYLTQLIGMDCYLTLQVLLGLCMHVGFAFLNSVTTKWSVRINVVFSIVKLLSMGTIVVTGMVKLGQGNVKNLQDGFAGSVWDPSAIAVGFLPGFVSFGGWESACSLAGEMKNPKRDLPLSLILSMLTVITIYLLINVAYFTVLTPSQFVASDAVALTFAQQALPSVPWLVPIMVILAATGSVNIVYLMLPRYVYAGGKDKQLPEVFSYLSVYYNTPIPAVGLELVIAVFLTSATFINIQGLIQILGVLIQIKLGLALLASLYLKRKKPELERAVTVPTAVVVLCFAVIVVIVSLSVYEKPYDNGLGCGIFLLGIPVWFAGQMCAKGGSSKVMGTVTVFLQKLLLVVPG